MKILSICIMLLLSSYAIADNRVVDEKTINDWGYRTVSVDKVQFIKRIKKVPGTGPAYYPRFTLWKECFDDIELLEKRMSEVKIEVSKMRDYDYRRMIVRNNCIYFISTDSQYFRLEFQPKMYELYKKYIELPVGS